MTPNFSDDELKCKCGCGQLPNLALAKMLELARHLAGNKPVVATSYMRCPAHNKKVGGAATSLHMYGMAADIFKIGEHCAATRSGKDAIKGLLQKAGFYTLEEDTWIHADLRDVFPEVLKIRKL